MNFQTIKITEQEKRLASDFMGQEYPLEIDFNSLMPVVEKIESEKNNMGYSVYKIQIDYHNCLIYSNQYDNRGVVGKSKIEAVWLAVIEFIKWYNLNNPKVNQPL